MSYILNHGIKGTELQNVSVTLNDRVGTYKLGVGVVIAVEPKGVLTPKEIRRKRMIILFIVSLAVMVVLSTIGAWLPDSQAGLGRMLILLSEIPAFAYSLISTRFLMKKGVRRNYSKLVQTNQKNPRSPNS
jgi:hypothetical protein